MLTAIATEDDMTKARTAEQITKHINRLETSRVRAVWPAEKAEITRKIRKLQAERDALRAE
jgi:hypothetical protein